MVSGTHGGRSPGLLFPFHPHLSPNTRLQVSYLTKKTPGVSDGGTPGKTERTAPAPTREWGEHPHTRSARLHRLPSPAGPLQAGDEKNTIWGISVAQEERPDDTGIPQTSRHLKKNQNKQKKLEGTETNKEWKTLKRIITLLKERNYYICETGTECYTRPESRCALKKKKSNKTQYGFEDESEAIF